MPDIYLEGMVGTPPWPDEPHFTCADVRAMLAGANGERVTVMLNCPGGLATEGLGVYHALRDHAPGVDVVIVGVAASAGSLIAMAGSKITMRAGAVLMIHDPAVPFVDGRGTEAEHRETADALGRMSGGYAEIYAARAGITAQEARNVMRAETWFTPAEAIAAGFADIAEDAAAQDAAAFSYSAYQHAPQHLLAGSRASGPSRQAVMAWIGGANPANANPKGMGMDPEENDDDLTQDQGEDTTTGGEGEDTTTGGEGEDTTTGGEGEDTTTGGEGDDEEDPVASEASAICDLVAMHGDGAAVAGDFIARRQSYRQVVAHYRQKGNTVPNPTGPRARIIRDERDTRRAGMTAALVAQFARRDPSDARARPFMSMSLAEMAATASGYRGSLRTADDRLRVFMDMHTTSDFPLSLSNALNKALADRYREQVPIYRKIAREKSFKDFRPHSMVRAGDFPMLRPLGEGGEIKSGTIGESAETVALGSYGIRFDVTRQTLINDDIGAIADAIADQGRMVARFEEATFFAACFGNSGNGPALSNTRAVFNTTDGTKAGSNGAISVTTLSAGRAGIRKHTSLDGAKLNLSPKILLVSPDKETEAEQVVTAITPASADNVNPFSGKLQVESTAELTGNGWYLLAPPVDAALFVFGFLEGSSAPRMRMEDVFGRAGMAWTLEHDFGAGASGRVGGWYNAGA